MAVEVSGRRWRYDNDANQSGCPSCEALRRGDEEHDRGGGVRTRQQDSHDRGSEHDPYAGAGRSMRQERYALRLPAPRPEMISQQASRESASRVSVTGLERRLRSGPGLRQVDSTQRRLGFGDQRRRHAQLGDPKAHEQDRGRRVAG